MKKIVVLEIRGNHTAEHAYYNGRKVFEGNVNGARRFKRQLREQGRFKWFQTSTPLKISDFVHDYMEGYRFVEVDGNQVHDFNI